MAGKRFFGSCPGCGVIQPRDTVRSFVSKDFKTGKLVRREVVQCRNCGARQIFVHSNQTNLEGEQK